MPQPKAVEYIYVCSSNTASEDNTRIQAILDAIPEARSLYVPQGRVSVRFQEKLPDEGSTSEQAG